MRLVNFRIRVKLECGLEPVNFQNSKAIQFSSRFEGFVHVGILAHVKLP